MAKSREHKSDDVSAGGRREAAGGGPAPAPRSPTGDPGAGAPLSNTAPANCNRCGSGCQILRSGIDSLYLSYPGQLTPERETELGALKLYGQSQDTSEQARAIIELYDHRFEVKDKGKGRFPFVLVDKWFHLQVSRRIAKTMPMVFAQIGSEILTRSGLMPSVVALNGVVNVLSKPEGNPTVSRVDLCVDFITDVDIESQPREAWITRADYFAKHYLKKQFSGLTFGQGGDLSARLYDKTLEITKSGKTYFYPIWQEQGWDGEYAVWRLEFQFRRNVLHELEINTVQDLNEMKAGLWAYAMIKWLRLAITCESDATMTRWPTHPLWEALILAPWDVERGEPLYRSSKSRVPSARQLFVNGLGSITSFMAKMGIKNFDEGLVAFARAAHQFHLRESAKTGKTLPTYAREKAESKARRFNTKLKDKSKGAKKANAYRTRKED